MDMALMEEVYHCRTKLWCFLYIGYCSVSQLNFCSLHYIRLSATSPVPFPSACHCATHHDDNGLNCKGDIPFKIFLYENFIPGLGIAMLVLNIFLFGVIWIWDCEIKAKQSKMQFNTKYCSMEYTSRTMDWVWFGELWRLRDLIDEW